MSDIVERLRETAATADYGPDRETAKAAADEIERLRATLREMLEYKGGAKCGCDDPYVMERARAALEERT